MVYIPKESKDTMGPGESSLRKHFGERSQLHAVARKSGESKMSAQRLYSSYSG